MNDPALPALLGGVPVRPQGPPGWPMPDADVLRAMQTAYHDGSWGKYEGTHVACLEKRLAQVHEVDFVASCASGTFAVELALRSLQVSPGDEVLMAAYDYGGNFLSIHAVGAIPVLVDIDSTSWNLSLDGLAEAIRPATRAVIASHLHGGLVPMRELMQMARERGVRVIEDAAQCPGATVQGQRAGTWGDAGVLSFGGSKLLSAGRGGALLTRHADIYQRARLWLNRGNHVCPLSELQAAVLLPQLDKLDTRNVLRANNVQLLIEQLRSTPGLHPFAMTLPDSVPGYYKLGFQLDALQFGLDRERLSAALRAEGIAFDAGFRALHVGRSPRRLRQATSLSEAERAHQGALILHHPVLLGTASDIAEVATAVQKTYANVEVLRQIGS